MLKRCNKCGIEKPATIENFYRVSGVAIKLRSPCKECFNARSDNYRVAHRQSIKSNGATYYQANKQKILARVVKYKRANKELRKKWQAKYRKKHAKRLGLKARLWVMQNRERANERARKWKSVRRRGNPQFAVACRLRAIFRQAVRRAEARKSVRTLSLIGCTLPQLMKHIQKQFKPGMSWDNRHLWHIDHIRPCASFDLADPRQQKLCFHFTNLQPL